MSTQGGRIHARYRLLEVRATERVTPSMLRVTLGGEELTDFISTGSDQRIKLCLPQPGKPTPLGRTRAEVFAVPRDQQPRQRTYTVRAFDADRLELTIDFVLHDHGGPGTTWAAGVRPGERIVTVGPSPSYRPNPEAEPLVLVGDETALPAIAAMLEELPAGAPVRLFVEVADATERQRIDTAANVAGTWLYRDGVPAGRSRLLVDALRAADLGPRAHVWAGAEAGIVHELRGHCQATLGLDRSQVYAVPYWRLVDPPVSVSRSARL
jgi:NADPH-dependent ferric siderophore reductase